MFFNLVIKFDKYTDIDNTKYYLNRQIFIFDKKVFKLHLKLMSSKFLYLL